MSARIRYLSIAIAIFIILFVSYRIFRLNPDDCPYNSFSSPDESFSISSKKLVTIQPYIQGQNVETLSTKLIPRRIIQTNENLEVPEKMALATKSIIDMNPGWEYNYFTDHAAKKFLEENYGSYSEIKGVLEAYKKLNPGAYKADLFRYAYLYIMGGVYIDMGMVALAPLDDLILEGDTFISPEDNGVNRVYNALIATRPRHPIIKKAIEMSVKNIEESRYTTNPLGITGPLLFANAFEQITGAKVDAGTDYGGGVRIINFNKYTRCESGKINDRGIDFFATRYANYRADQSWYNTNPHYSKLWKERKVFG